MNITAENLTGQHVGQTVAIHEEGTQITGLLSGFIVTADIIAEDRLCEIHPELIAGEREYELRVGYKSISVAPSTEIQIKES